jgi:hypothetical protein
MMPLVGETADTAMAATVIVAVNDFVASDADVAVTDTVMSLGGGAGAVYVVAAPFGVEVGETLPQGEGEQDTVQVTPPLLGSLATVAVSC